LNRLSNLLLPSNNHLEKGADYARPNTGSPETQQS
jgi:hypothetical protein